MTFYDKNALKLAHAYLNANVGKGDTVIDATAGKGRDTLLLASLVGENGKVIAIDIQKEAIDEAEKLIAEHGVSDRVTFVCDSHENIKSYADKANCVVFNLGWLPGSDHEIRTSTQTSIKAIKASTEMLTDDGFVLVCIYYGGLSGFEERDGVLDFLKTRDQKEFTVAITQFANRKGCPPIFAVIEKNR